jgi:AraC family transcriptional activator of pobA
VQQEYNREGGGSMTYPQELRERTPTWDSDYPIRFYRNHCPANRQDNIVLSLHWHEHFEIIDIQFGRATFHIDSRPYEAEAGDLLFVPAGGLHVGYSPLEEAIEYVAIVFNQSLLRIVQPDSVHERYIAPFLDGKAHLPVKLSGKDESMAVYRKLIREATAEYERKSPAYQLMVKHTIQLLFVHLARSYLPPNLADKPAIVRNLEPFKPLIKHIEKQYDKPLSIESAARMVSLNPFHFCKTFKKLTGCTFVDYVNRHRMNVADQLLRDTDLSVTEIADRVGCGNTNYFTKLYKKYKGFPPSHARRQ